MPRNWFSKVTCWLIKFGDKDSIKGLSLPNRANMNPRFNPLILSVSIIIVIEQVAWVLAAEDCRNFPTVKLFQWHDSRLAVHPEFSLRFNA